MVEENEELLARGLRTPGLFLLPGITPYNYCKSCDRAVKRAASGESIRSTRTLPEWGECGDGCGSCLIISKRKIGGGNNRKKVSVLLYGLLFTMVRFDVIYFNSWMILILYNMVTEVLDLETAKRNIRLMILFIL